MLTGARVRLWVSSCVSNVTTKNPQGPGAILCTCDSCKPVNLSVPRCRWHPIDKRAPAPAQAQPPEAASKNYIATAPTPIHDTAPLARLPPPYTRRYTPRPADRHLAARYPHGAKEPPGAKRPPNMSGYQPQQSQTADASAVDIHSRAVSYTCGDCDGDVQLKRGEPIRCRNCGHRVLYKKRTNRYA